VDDGGSGLWWEGGSVKVRRRFEAMGRDLMCLRLLHFHMARASTPVRVGRRQGTRPSTWHVKVEILLHVKPGRMLGHSR
jgi:hypothetical protein